MPQLDRTRPPEVGDRWPRIRAVPERERLERLAALARGNFGPMLILTREALQEEERQLFPGNVSFYTNEEMAPQAVWLIGGSEPPDWP